eukprot:3027927-Rhodomonas_salina.1
MVAARSTLRLSLSRCSTKDGCRSIDAETRSQRLTVDDGHAAPSSTLRCRVHARLLMQVGARSTLRLGANDRQSMQVQVAARRPTLRRRVDARLLMPVGARSTLRHRVHARRSMTVCARSTQDAESRLDRRCQSLLYLCS